MDEITSDVNIFSTWLYDKTKQVLFKHNKVVNSESGVTQTIADITGQIAMVDILLADQSLTNEVRTALEAQRILLTELKTQFEPILQELKKSRMKRATGNCSAQLMT